MATINPLWKILKIIDQNSINENFLAWAFGLVEPNSSVLEGKHYIGRWET